MVRKPLNSDELGAKGEAYFDGICVDAKLISNPSTRDRTGWDRIVEFPQEVAIDGMSLDRRHPPLSCHVQIKAIWEGRRSVRLRLSSAERLAKDPKPSFVYVVVVGLEKTIRAAHLIHLTKAPLEKILARLRKEYKKSGGSAPINSKFIDLSLALGQQISTSGDGLRAAIELAIGGPRALLDYIERKKSEINTVGGITHSGKVSFKTSNINELVDAFLGLRPIAFSDFDHVETRFGIALPVFPELRGKVGNITITPTPTPCRLICRNGTTELPAVIDGEIRVPGIPGLPREHSRILFRHPMFDMTIPAFPEHRFNMKGNEEAWRTGAHLPKTWVNVSRMLRFLSKPGALINLQHEGQTIIEFRSDNLEGQLDDEANRLCEELAASICQVLDLAALEPIGVTRSEILASREDISHCLAFSGNEVNGTFLSFEAADKSVTWNSGGLFHFFNVFPLENLFIAYSVLASAHRSVDRDSCWDLRTEGFGEICALSNADDDYRCFRDRVVKRDARPGTATYYSTRFSKC
jgi:hypothetical protein